MTMSNDEFRERTGLQVPTTAEEITTLGQQIMEMVRLMPPAHRSAFIAELTPQQLHMLNLLEMPEDFTDSEALEKWLSL